MGSSNDNRRKALDTRDMIQAARLPVAEGQDAPVKPDGLAVGQAVRFQGVGAPFSADGIGVAATVHRFSNWDGFPSGGKYDPDGLVHVNLGPNLSDRIAGRCHIAAPADLIAAVGEAQDATRAGQG